VCTTVQEDSDYIRYHAHHWISSARRITFTTHLHKLPLELQELTLSHITPCDIERAKYAALLDIGIPFAWSVTHEREIVPLRLLNMQHPSRPRQISKTYPKQDITIWEDYLGLSYQPRLDGHKADVGSHSLG
jgi:hypothetical protein